MSQDESLTFARLVAAARDERLVEYPYVLKNLAKGRILDVGCLESHLAVELSKMSLEVVGIDIRDPKEGFKEPVPENFVRCDCRKMPFRDGVFDQAIAVSTVEHVGLICYGLERSGGYAVDGEGDRKTVSEMARVTREGDMIVTIPYGLGSHYWMRIYDALGLSDLFSGLMLTDVSFFAKRDGYWSEVSKEEARGVVNAPKVRCVACVRVRRAW